MASPEPLREPAQSGPCSRKRFNWPRHSIAEGGPKPRARTSRDGKSRGPEPHAPLHPAPTGRRDLSMHDVPDPWEGQDGEIDIVPDDSAYLYDADPDGEPAAPQVVTIEKPAAPASSLYVSPSIVPPTDLAELRATVDRMAGGYGSDRARRATGFAALDASLTGGGLPADSVIDRLGAPGSGAHAFAGRLLADAHTRGETVAVVDSTGSFSPVPFGFGGDRVLWLRVPGADANDIAWAIEQILRSRAVSLVVGLIPPALSVPASRRLQLAAETGSAMARLVREPHVASSACAVELRFAPLASPAMLGQPRAFPARASRVTVARVRGGSPGATFVLSIDDERESMTVGAPAAAARTPRRIASSA
jgi:hypothetical protein